MQSPTNHEPSAFPAATPTAAAAAAREPVASVVLETATSTVDAELTRLEQMARESAARHAMYNTYGFNGSSNHNRRREYSNAGCCLKCLCNVCCCGCCCKEETKNDFFSK